MSPEEKLKELEQACAALSVAVSYEALAANVRVGALCRVKGNYRVIIDKRATPNERAATLAEAINRLGDSSLSPHVRELVDSYGVRRAS